MQEADREVERVRLKYQEHLEVHEYNDKNYCYIFNIVYRETNTG